MGVKHPNEKMRSETSLAFRADVGVNNEQLDRSDKPGFSSATFYVCVTSGMSFKDCARKEPCRTASKRRTWAGFGWVRWYHSVTARFCNYCVTVVEA